MVPSSVDAGVRPKVRPEGRNQIADGAFDGVSSDSGGGGRSELVGSEGMGEADEDKAALVFVEGVQEGVIRDPGFVEEFLEDAKSARVLGLGVGGGSLLTGRDSSLD